jgi:hypothetical protein
MPQIIVIADVPSTEGETPVMFQERVNVTDFESDHFSAQLVERLGWAVGDADEHDRHARRLERRRGSRRREADMAQNRPAARPTRQRRSAKLVTTAS